MKAVLYQRSRPNSLDEYVFVDKNMEKKIREWVKKREMPNLLLCGRAGTGKSALAHALCVELDIDPSDILFINASNENGIDTIRERIVPFVETISTSPNGRVVILDECDHLSNNAQAALRALIIDNMDNSRFILTANYSHKIIEPLWSRCQVFNINSLDRNQYMLRVAEVITEEGIKFDLETLEHYTDKNYPDMRGIFNDVERYTFDNTWKIVETKADCDKPEWMLSSIELIQKGQYRDARNLICKNITYEEYSDFYRMMYENIDWWAKEDDEKRDQALLIIKDHLVADHTVGDREIVLSACLTKLSLI